MERITAWFANSFMEHRGIRVRILVMTKVKRLNKVFSADGDAPLQRARVLATSVRTILLSSRSATTHPSPALPYPSCSGCPGISSFFFRRICLRCAPPVLGRMKPPRLSCWARCGLQTFPPTPIERSTPISWRFESGIRRRKHLDLSNVEGRSIATGGGVASVFPPSHEPRPVSCSRSALSMWRVHSCCCACGCCDVCMCYDL